MSRLRHSCLLKCLMLMCGGFTVLPSMAQAASETIYITPLFEYPVAPEELPDLRSKSDYLMDHFWDGMDFSTVSTIDQNALNDAFSVYASAMIYASREKAMSSINNLLKRVKGNPTAVIQLTKAAEESLYGPRASIWSDEAYMPFLKATLAEKKIPDYRKARYSMQLDLLNSTASGKPLPSLRITRRDGVQTHYTPGNRVTLIEFGNPSCDDCRFAKTKLLMAVDLEDMIEEGFLDIAFIVPDAVPEDQAELLEEFKAYPESWSVGIAYGGDDVLDLRSTPSFYILDPKGKILVKNLGVNEAVDQIRALYAGKDKK